MFLKTLKLTNIRSYISETIEFPEGSVLLSGDIGSGKSSILLAIEFALFGIRRSGLPGSLLLRTGETTGSVELNFTIDTKNITIKRNLKRGKTDIQQATGYIIIDDIKTEGTAIELKSKLFDLLGYPKELLTKSKSLIYRYTVYTPQEEMKQILHEDEEQRLNILRKVFAIDKYRRIRDNTSLFTKQLKEKKKELEGRLIDLEPKQTEKTKYEQHLNILTNQLTILSPKIKAIKLKLSQKKETLTKLEQEITLLNTLRKDLEITNSKINEKILQLKKNIQNIAELKDTINTIKNKLDKFPSNLNEQSLENTLNLKEKELSETTQTKTLLEEKLTTLKAKLKELTEELKEKASITSELNEKDFLHKQLAVMVHSKKDILSKSEETEKSLESLKTQIREYEVKKWGSNEIIQNITSLEKCPTCYQDVPNEHKERISANENKKLSELNSQLTALNIKSNQTTKEIQAIKEQLDTIHTKEKELERIDETISSLTLRLKTLTEKEFLLSNLKQEETHHLLSLDTLNKTNLDQKSSEITQLKQKLKDAREKTHLTTILTDKNTNLTNLTNEQQSLKTTLESLKNSLESIEKQLKEKANIEDTYNLQKKEYETITLEEKTIEIKLAELEQEKQGITTIITSLKKEITIKLTYKNSLKKLNRLHHWLEEYFIKLMNTIEKHVMLRVNREFNDLLINWFNTLMESETLTIRLDDRFTPIIEQDGYEIGINNLSGGEKTSLALAYRLALNKVINDLISTIKTKDLIILDEPTDGFSSEQLDKVRTVLEQLKIKQVIIVSHESKIESFVENIIRINKEENTSKISIN
jgi:exonuclease SbcC